MDVQADLHLCFSNVGKACCLKMWLESRERPKSLNCQMIFFVYRILNSYLNAKFKLNENRL